MKEKIEQLLNEMRPAFERHRGNIELVDVNVETGVVSVRLQGACKHCPLSEMTLKGAVESTLMSEVPGVTEVIAVA